MRREQNTRAEEKPATDGGRAEPQKKHRPGDVRRRARGVIQSGP